MTGILALPIRVGSIRSPMALGAGTR